MAAPLSTQPQNRTTGYPLHFQAGSTLSLLNRQWGGQHCWEENAFWQVGLDVSSRPVSFTGLFLACFAGQISPFSEATVGCPVVLLTWQAHVMLRAPHVNALAGSRQRAAHSTGSSAPTAALHPHLAARPAAHNSLQLARHGWGSSQAFTYLVRPWICHASSSSSERDPYVAAGQRLQSLINGVG
jgi:hypothetical protein